MSVEVNQVVPFTIQSCRRSGIQAKPSTHHPHHMLGHQGLRGKTSRRELLETEPVSESCHRITFLFICICRELENYLIGLGNGVEREPKNSSVGLYGTGEVLAGCCYEPGTAGERKDSRAKSRVQAKAVRKPSVHAPPVALGALNRTEKLFS